VLESNENMPSSINFLKWEWLRANRGSFELVARRIRKSQVTSEFVRLVFWEKRKSSSIRRSLVRLGAPMTGRQRGGE
jgi:hypothetical protein